MSDMKVVKKEALSNLCPECTEFFRSHKMVEGTPGYISNTVECKKCKLQFDMMNDKIATIWKII
jgi:hypothetical protein